MRSPTWAALLLIIRAQALPAATVCESYDYTTTLTFTDYATQHVVDGMGARLLASPFMNTKTSVIPTSDCDSSDGLNARQWPPRRRATTTSRSVVFVTRTTATPTTTTTVASSSSSANSAVVTNKAYIDTVLRQHNAHRANHSVNAVTWNAALGETAKKIASTCIYQHNTTIDCPNGGCYGQNIGAGYLDTQMALLISNGFYDSEVNSYTYYGKEPDLNTFGAWGHFSQIVWKSTSSVACYTMDCTSQGGLKFPGGGGQGIRPFFTVCNYGPPGNYIGQFTPNVPTPLGQPSVFAGYKCPTPYNCEG